VRTGAPRPLTFDIHQFGYDIFRRPPSTFAPVDRIPVGPDYVIGPGDEIRIAVWGFIDGQWSPVVDRNGNISLPQIGILGVNGLTFDQLRVALRKEFEKHYTNFEMNVTMGQLRTITVFVLGNAKNPGAYTVSSLSTLFNALLESGGPTKSGTMRDIQLKRAGKTILHFDCYDFLLKGNKTQDFRLMPEDVIFIPNSGPLVGIAGNVKRPAIYEISKPSRILDIIDLAGGLKSLAFTGRFQLQRVIDHRYIRFLEGDLIDIRARHDKNISLQDGDLLKIYAVAELKNLISLTGAVLMPGDYAVEPGVTTIKEVVERAGGLQAYAASQAEVTRLTITPSGPLTNVFSFDIRAALERVPEQNITLQPYDYVMVHTVPDWQLYRKVTVFGEVNYPGTYAIQKGEQLSSLIERAGGWTVKAHLKGATFKRESVKNLQQRQLESMVNRLETELLAYTSADVSSALTADEARVISEENRHKRVFINNLRQIQATGRMVVQLDDPDKLRGTSHDVELEDGDYIYIPSNPQTIQVIGAVFNPTSFVYQPNKDYSNYINMCGGFTETADSSKVYILKSSGVASQPSQSVIWDSFSRKWAFGSSGILDPGDTIVVPSKLERIAWLRQVKDLTQILYQIATTAGVMIVAF
jgi:protein involved in polysaccharide export with SLBB domain